MTQLATKYSQFLRPELHSMLKEIDEMPAGQSTPGSPGLPGATGATGSPGVGVPVGGTAGQILSKIDSTNYNTQWENVPRELPIGGTTNQLLSKVDNTDYNVTWTTPVAVATDSFVEIDGGTADYFFGGMPIFSGGLP
jgi:hypothetical protein